MFTQSVCVDMVQRRIQPKKNVLLCERNNIYLIGEYYRQLPTKNLNIYFRKNLLKRKQEKNSKVLLITPWFWKTYQDKHTQKRGGK